MKPSARTKRAKEDKKVKTLGSTALGLGLTLIACGFLIVSNETAKAVLIILGTIVGLAGLVLLSLPQDLK